MTAPKEPDERWTNQTVSLASGEELWLECYYCRRPCAHPVLARASADWVLSNHGGWYRDTHDLIQCGGCKKTGYRNWRQFFNHGDSEPMVCDEQLFPTRSEPPMRRLMDGLAHVPQAARTAYVEAVRAALNNQPLASGLAIRAVIECVCNHKKVRGRTLETKIDGLGPAGLLGPTQIALLHRLRFLGNRAAHSAEVPSVTDLNAALDIAEHLLRGIYVLPKSARDLPRKNRRTR